ncbi:histidine kinase [uncultured Mucilaginibacter sp.]|uniref:sensor histidine kinase n=1 Tax=uncultured Mucilaginibacter sp. TaxID=797541 RepID=UPI0025F7B85E|nr:histidine kinase [uncultured Mucilaginibacter sp.]
MSKKQSWFWPVQISCWLLIGFLNWIAQYSSGSFSNVNLYLNLAGMCAGGFAVTSLYRAYFRRYKATIEINATRLVAFLFASAFVQAALWLVILIIMMLPFLGNKPLSIMPILFQIVPLMGIMLAWDSVYLGYYLVRRYHSTEVEKWKLEAEVRQAQLGTLRAQINPHFLFNSLNNIRALILEDPSLARQTLTRFSEIFRHALQHTDGREINLAEEVDILKQYLELVKIQYEDKLTYHINVDDACLADSIPPMVLQLLVENAIKHGIALQNNGGEIRVNISRNSNKLILMVTNTGTLAINNRLEDSLGIGLNNIKERLRLLYGNNATLNVTEESPYVNVTITIIK